MELRDEDLKIEACRPDRYGGQHTGFVSTGVRITHLPTGRVVESDDERSQYRNVQAAKAKLIALLDGSTS